MAKIGRPGLPSDRRQEVWERWKAGDSISEISRAVGSPPGSIFSILLPFGGIYSRRSIAGRARRIWPSVRRSPEAWPPVSPSGRSGGAWAVRPR